MVLGYLLMPLAKHLRTFVPMACYALIALFALFAGRMRIVAKVDPEVGSH